MDKVGVLQQLTSSVTADTLNIPSSVAVDSSGGVYIFRAVVYCIIPLVVQLRLGSMDRVEV